MSRVPLVPSVLAKVRIVLQQGYNLFRAKKTPTLQISTHSQWGSGVHRPSGGSESGAILPRFLPRRMRLVVNRKLGY
jgi:hypothetical protein